MPNHQNADDQPTSLKKKPTTTITVKPANTRMHSPYLILDMDQDIDTQEEHLHPSIRQIANLQPRIYKTPETLDFTPRQNAHRFTDSLHIVQALQVLQTLQNLQILKALQILPLLQILQTLRTLQLLQNLQILQTAQMLQNLQISQTTLKTLQTLQVLKTLQTLQTLQKGD